MTPARIFIVDDHAAVREGLRRSLEAHGVAVVGEAGTGMRAIADVARLDPEIVLLDVSLPDMDGVEVARRLRTTAPHARVVMLTMYADRTTVTAAFAAGASGYLAKDCTTADIVAAIEKVRAGETAGSPATLAPAPAPRERATDAVLSQREREVLQLVAEGASTTDVARQLFISVKTAKNHLANIYAKLGAGDRTQAVVQGLRLGLIRLR